MIKDFATRQLPRRAPQSTAHGGDNGGSVPLALDTPAPAPTAGARAAPIDGYEITAFEQWLGALPALGGLPREALVSQQQACCAFRRHNAALRLRTAWHDANGSGTARAANEGFVQFHGAVIFARRKDAVAALRALRASAFFGYAPAAAMLAQERTCGRRRPRRSPALSRSRSRSRLAGAALRGARGRRGRRGQGGPRPRARPAAGRRLRRRRRRRGRLQHAAARPHMALRI